MSHGDVAGSPAGRTLVLMAGLRSSKFRRLLSELIGLSGYYDYCRVKPCSKGQAKTVKVTDNVDLPLSDGCG